MTVEEDLILSVIEKQGRCSEVCDFHMICSSVITAAPAFKPVLQGRDPMFGFLPEMGSRFFYLRTGSGYTPKSVIRNQHGNSCYATKNEYFFTLYRGMKGIRIGTVLLYF